MDDLFKPLMAVDWSSLEAVGPTTEKILRTLAADRSALSQLVADLEQNPALLSMCEHYDLLDKLVLFGHPESGFRLRLHLFLPGHFDRPHNHRWTYSSLLLRGGYRHTLYGEDTALSADIDVRTLQPVMVHEQRAGDFYTLSHRMIHSVIAEPYTVSLIVRGPSVKDRFLVMDRATNQAWWQHGMVQETQDVRAAKVMAPGYLRKVRTKLSELDIINA